MPRPGAKAHVRKMVGMQLLTAEEHVKPGPRRLRL